MLAVRSENELSSVADTIVAAGGQVAYRRVDVTRPEDLRALVDLATQRFGRLDVLVSNAGIAVNALLGSGELKAGPGR